MIVDLALDSSPTLRAVTSAAGPTFAPEELAGRKMIALFDRAEARDFSDVYQLAKRYGKDRLIARAAQIDSGFNPAVLAEMMRALNRFADDELPVSPEQARPLREFFAIWAAELVP